MTKGHPVQQLGNLDNIVRPLQILEVGAINTELLDAASANPERRRHNIQVRAIDLHSSNDERIEEQDFFLLPFRDSNISLRYDVIVCSMVLNSVPAPEDRGRMLLLIREHLRPGGLCFLTLPRLCLTQSKYITVEGFVDLLRNDVELTVVERKESPKIIFFVLTRPPYGRVRGDRGANELTIVREGKRFRNTFSVVFPSVLGQKSIVERKSEASTIACSRRILQR